MCFVNASAVRYSETLMSMAVAKFCAQAEQTRDQLRHMARIASREFVRPNSHAATEEKGTDRRVAHTRSFGSSSSTATRPGGPVGPGLAHYHNGASWPTRTGVRRRDPKRASHRNAGGAYRAAAACPAPRGGRTGHLTSSPEPPAARVPARQQRFRERAQGAARARLTTASGVCDFSPADAEPNRFPAPRVM